MDIPFVESDQTAFHLTSLQFCEQKTKQKTYFNKIGIVVPQSSDDPQAVEKEKLRSDLKTYFEKVVLPRNGLMRLQVVDFKSSEELRNQVKENQNQDYCFSVEVSLEGFDLKNNNYDIKFSYTIDQLPDSNQPQFNELIKTPDLVSWNLWFNYGATKLFQELAEFIARSKQDKPDFSSVAPLYNQTIGYAPMTSQKFLDISPVAQMQLNQFFPFFFMIIYWIPLYYLTSKISAEKESKAREGMKMMGLQDGSYLLSWFIVFFGITALCSLIATLMSCLGVLPNVNPFLFFVFAQLYAMTLYGEAFLTVAFLPTKRSSGISVSLFHLISFYLSQVLASPSTSSALQYSLSLFPNVCLNQIIKVIFFYNFNTSQGLSFGTASISYQGYSYQGGMLILLLDFFIWTFLGLYFDQIIQSQFGSAKKWNFLCSRSQNRVPRVADGSNEKLLTDDEIGNKNQRNFEQVSDNLKKQEKNKECLIVRGLIKQFGDKTAVAGANLTMYKGQIFALLGHNGAGKTTTISMLTGLLEPTAGFAEVFGIDIFQNMDQVRQMLGVCPQHDVLFDFLTPKDHLRLFAAFKGSPQEEIQEQVDRMLKEIDLYDQRDQMSKDLSGGQKRKLSVAIAMIGNSKIVMLDEPTSGMDTSARRRLWDMLKKNKAGRIVILTTHYMDEADMLGDRISIMAEGDVQCTGSSLFLKNRYGVGYNLVVAKKDRSPAPHIEQFVMNRIKDALKLQEVSSEIAFQLPKSSSDQFKQFFEEFDNNLENLGIRSYGVGITTLEEVFLKIGHGEEMEQERAIAHQTNQEKEKVEEEEFDLQKDSLHNAFFMHLRALLHKEIMMQIRDGKNLFIGIIFPILLIFTGLALATVNVIKEGKVTPLSVSIYPHTNNGQTIGLYYNSKSEYLDESDIKQFMEESFIASNSDLFSLLNAVDLGVDSEKGKLESHIKKLDEAINSYSFDQGQGPFFGQFYLNSLPSKSKEYPLYSGVLLLNSTSQEVAGVWGAYASQAFLTQYLKDQNKLNPSEKLNLKFTYDPFPISQLFEGVNKAASGTNAAIMIAFAWMMISDQLIQNIIRERQKNIKHQIMISGSSLAAYWCGHYVADILLQTFPAVAAIVGVYLFDIKVPNSGYLFLVTIFANPIFIYFFSFLFEKDEAGSLAIKLIYIVVGAVAPIAISFLQVINQQTQKVGKILRWFFYPLPIYSLSFGFISISNKDIYKAIQQLDYDINSYDWNIAGPSLLFLLLSIPFYLLMVFLVERKILNFKFCRLRNRRQQRDVNSMQMSLVARAVDNETVDNDITEEEQRVKQASPLLPIRTINLKKNFGDVEAIKDISFGLEYGECFALLGVSGAGKTTLFQCLTGNFSPSNGQVTISGFDVSTAGGFEAARKLIGYCPQFDAIFEGLTVYEHLSIYARLKGIPDYLRERLISQQIVDMDLVAYRNVYANNLSGGNKRKLSVAMAVIGNPPLVFLDEPSTGVDPQAKRFMWNIVSKISTQRKKSSVIITTHSMEEAEALCTKMGIMVGGVFKCFGSSQHIKDKYGTGYEIEVKIRTLREEEVQEIQARAGVESDQISLAQAQKILRHEGLLDPDQDLQEGTIGEEYFKILSSGVRVNALEFVRWQFTEGYGNRALNHLEGLFKQMEVIEHYGSSWKVKVSRDNYSIGYLFGMMEDVQSQFHISEYSVTQTTLEQIFNNFALAAEVREGKQRHSTKVRSSKGKSNDI